MLTYVYDILLNFNTRFINFFEWEENEVIAYKKVAVIMVNSKTINDFKNNYVVIYKGLSDGIYILRDKYYAIGVLIKEKEVKEISSLCLEDSSNIMNIYDLSLRDIGYMIKEKRLFNYCTRYENMIIDSLREEFLYLYKSNLITKLKFYFYEYFNEISNDKIDVYKRLVNSLNSFNQKHIQLYNIAKLSVKK